MSVKILTTDDLESFKKELFSELRQVFSAKQKLELSKQQREWLRTKEVCSLMGISLSKLQYMRNNGEIKFTRIGGTIFYSTNDIQQMLSSGNN